MTKTVNECDKNVIFVVRQISHQCFACSMIITAATPTGFHEAVSHLEIIRSKIDKKSVGKH